MIYRNGTYLYKTYEDYLREMDEQIYEEYIRSQREKIIGNIGGNKKMSTTNNNLVIIPELILFTKSYYTGSTTRQSQKLFGYWSNDNLSFLDYNPKIWLFRYKNYKKEIDTDNQIFVSHKKYTHAPHLNGVGYEGKKYYNGSIICPATGITSLGVHTEFNINVNNNTPFQIDIDPYDWFYMKNKVSAYKLSDDQSLTPPSGYYLKVMGRDNLSFPFRLCVCIDDPRGFEQKIVGPLSDIMFLRIKNNNFVFMRNSSDLSRKRFDM
jgi:hypothetical protein